jgi:hypothetical protein
VRRVRGVGKDLSRRCEDAPSSRRTLPKMSRRRLSRWPKANRLLVGNGSIVLASVASGIIGEGGSQSSRHRTRRVRSDRLGVDEDQRLPVAGNFATSCAATPAGGTGA